MRNYSMIKQAGVSLVGLIFGLAIVAVLAILGMKVVPTIAEYNSIKNAVEKAQKEGASAAEIRNSFSKQASAGYIDSISGNDLEIVPSDSGGFDVSFAYDKKIPLVGPASLLIEYAGTTAKSRKPAKGGA